LRIEYLTYSEIDKQKWDACINHAANRLIYAKSFYLDAMAANWDALVLNDYAAVMPLTWKKKFGISYLYQPAFLQQGGIFSAQEITGSITEAFVQKAFSHFKFAEITFNYQNNLQAAGNIQITERNNFILPLQKKYEEIYAGYSSIAVKNLKRAGNAGLSYHFTADYLPVLKLYKKLYAERMPSFSSDDYYNFSKICKKLSEENNLIVRKVNDANNELLAAAVLLIDKKRLYNIISCVTPEGKHAQANYFLYDRLIQEFSNTAFTLDFEGSDVKGIAEFYSRFNPVNEPYPFVKVNNLHPFIKLFKH
jgi:hypothetical protein